MIDVYVNPRFFFVGSWVKFGLFKSFLTISCASFFHNLLMNIPAIWLATFLSCSYVTMFITLLKCPFLGFVEGTIRSPLYIIPFSIVSRSLLYLKCLTIIEQLLDIFIFILSRILLNTLSCLVSILTWFRGKTPVSIHCTIFSSIFLWFSIFL